VNEGSGWFVSYNLIGSISSDVIGWCYKTFQSVLGLRTKEEAMPLQMLRVHLKISTCKMFFLNIFTLLTFKIRQLLTTKKQ
jgi:hypothetical protein